MWDAQWKSSAEILLIAGHDGGWMINAGADSGATVGSVFAVRPATVVDQDDQVIGYVRVTSVSNFGANVQPIAYSQIPVPENLPQFGRCELALLDYQIPRKKIAVDDKASNGKSVSSEERLSLTRRLKKSTSKLDELLVVVDDINQADLLLRLDEPSGSTVSMITDVQASVGKFTSAFQPIDVSEMEEVTPTVIERVVRADNLLELVEISQTERELGKMSIDLDLRLVRYRDDGSPEEIPWSTFGFQPRDGEKVGFQVANNGQTSVDVTLLHIGPSSEISCFYPSFGEYNRMAPGERESLLEARFHYDGMQWEHLVVIAVHNSGTAPVDFRYLESLSLLTESNRFTTRSGSSAGPMDELLSRALSGVGSRRGFTTTEINNYSMNKISFRVFPSESEPRK